MSKPSNAPRNLSKNPSINLSEPENQLKNQYLKQKKNKPTKKQPQSQNDNSNQSTSSTSNSLISEYEKREERKWSILLKFQHVATKAHYIHNLKFQTLFLSYSLAEKTVYMVIDQNLIYQYWALCCLFLSMKYEEIYPPRLRDLSMLVKQLIRPQEYFKSELKLLQFINLDLNFISLNTILSEYLHAVTERQRYFIFYFLEIALSIRSQLKKFNLQEIVISVVYLLCSHRLHFYPKQQIDSVKFERIEECSKYIILSQTSLSERFPFLYKKYRSQRMKSVATESIPTVETLTAILVKKTESKEKTPKIVGFCKAFDDQNMIEEENDSSMAVISRPISETYKVQNIRY